MQLKQTDHIKIKRNGQKNFQIDGKGAFYNGSKTADSEEGRVKSADSEEC